MIKGCHKSVVFLKNTGSDIFDEAYFIVKSSNKNDCDKDIVLEAMNIANGFCEKKKKGNFINKIIAFFIGCVLGAIVTFFVT